MDSNGIFRPDRNSFTRTQLEQPGRQYTFNCCAVSMESRYRKFLHDGDQVRNVDDVRVVAELTRLHAG